jgi:hypothetical protein
VVRLPGALLLLLLLGACSHSLPGVLTLAPAGMRTTGACVSHPDGTLTMPSGSTADSPVYVDAGGVTITITAQASSATPPSRIEVWFADASIGNARLETTEVRSLAFHAHAGADGPTTLRIGYRTDAEADAEASAEVSPTVHLEKVVITEP